MSSPQNIESIVSSISDSQTVDWGSDSTGAETADPELVEMLQIIERVGLAHQQASDLGDPDSSLPFRTWGHLRLLERVGRGNYGEVFRAWDANLSREVALKLFHADAEESIDFLRREELLEEARTLAKLRQENIVRVHGADIHRGRVGFWMEYIVGEPLNEDLESRGAKSPEEVVSIGVKVCRALAAAHSAGILHRDIKASNIVRETGGHIYLMDFGAGALLRGAAEGRQQRAGTPLYMAPEVLLEGKSSPQSDIYSLGVFLFHALTLRYPHEGETLNDLVEAHRIADKLSLESLRPELPKELRQTIERCLRSKPAERFASATAVEDALREVLVPRRPAAPSAINALLAAAIVILLLTQVPWIWLRDRVAGVPAAEAIASVAVLAFDDEGLPSEETAYLAFGLGSHLTDRLSDLGGVRVTPWANAKRYSPEDRPLREAAEVLNVEALVVGSLIARGNQVSGSVTLIDGATEEQLWTYAFEDDRDRFLDVERTISEGLGRAIAGGLTQAEREALQEPAARSVDAYELYLRGAMALQRETEEANDQAYEYFQRAVDIDPQLHAARIGMGAVHLNRYFFGWQGGYSNLHQAERLFRSAATADPADAIAARGLCMVLCEQYEPMQAAHLALTRAVADPLDTEALVTVAQAFAIAGLTKLACDLSERVLSEDPSNIAAAWIRVWALAWDDRYEESVQAGEQYFLRFGEDHEVHTWVGYSYLALGQYADAALHLDRARHMRADNVYVSIYHAVAAKHLGQDENATRIAQEKLAHVQLRLAAYPDNQRLRWYSMLLNGLLDDRAGIEDTEIESDDHGLDKTFYLSLDNDPDVCREATDLSPWFRTYLCGYLNPECLEPLGITNPDVVRCVGEMLERTKTWQDEYIRAHAGELSLLGLSGSS